MLDISSVETTVKYEGYLLRQQQAVVAGCNMPSGAEFPRRFPSKEYPGCLAEMVQRFSETRPETLGQAQRIPGVTPAAVAVVGAYLDRF